MLPTKDCQLWRSLADRTLALVNEKIEKQYKEVVTGSIREILDFNTFASYVVHDLTYCGDIVEAAVAKAEADIFKEIAAENSLEALAMTVSKELREDVIQYVRWQKDKDVALSRHTINKIEVLKKAIKILYYKFVKWLRSFKGEASV